MTGAERVAAAEADAERARDRLLDTVQDLAEMLEPRRLMRELWEDAKVKGADLAGEAVDAVKSRPVAAGGVAAALALFLAREPIAELAGKLIGSKDRKAKPAKQTKPAGKARKTKRAATKTPPVSEKQTENVDD